jgi:hypothetical protein
VAVQRDKIGYSHLFGQSNERFDLIQVVIHYNGDHMNTLVWMNPVLMQHFESRAGPFKSPDLASLAIMLFPVRIIHRDARFIQAGFP